MEDDLANLGVYTKYQAFSSGPEHPTCLMESKSLHFAKKEKVRYIVKNPIVAKHLSSAQMDSVAMAMEAMEYFSPELKYRRGFLLGDGAGVGKSRQIFAMIAEHFFLTKRKKAIFITCAESLYEPAMEEMKLFELKNLCRLSHFKMNSTHNQLPDNGVMFLTYSMLYHTSNGQSRLEQIFDWVQDEDFDGLIIFDECHRAKNFSENTNESTSIGSKTVELQSNYLNARVIYSSATALSDIKHVGYLQRLGLFGSGTKFPTATSFIHNMQTKGTSALEMLAVELHSKGLYIARALSMHGIMFETLVCKTHTSMYNQCTYIWMILLCMAKCKENSSDMRRFWASHQRFFGSLILSLKIPTVTQLAEKELAEGNSVLIGIQSTGESGYNLSDSYQIVDRYSAAREILLETAQRFGNISLENATEDESVEDDLPPDNHVELLTEWAINSWIKLEHQEILFKNEKSKAYSEKHRNLDVNTKKKLEKDRIHMRNKYFSKLQKMLRKEYSKVKNYLPPNPIDDVIARLGGSKNVAEMTGRHSRQETINDRLVMVERNPDLDNSLEHKRFMENEVRVGIISEVFSAGIGLHCDRQSSRKRVHLTIQLPWSADRLIQQFGRTNRANQTKKPKYVMIVTDIAGEERFKSDIVKKLKLMGALTRGDRLANQVTETLSNCDFDEKLWKIGIEKLCEDLAETRAFSSEDEAIWKMLRKMDVIKKRKTKFSVNGIFKTAPKFMNKIMAIPVELQRIVIEKLTEKIREEMTKLKMENRLDFGIKDCDFGAGSDCIVLDVPKRFLTNKEEYTYLWYIQIKRVLPWNTVQAIIDSNKFAEYLSDNLGPVLCLPTKNSNEHIIFRPYSCKKIQIFSYEKDNLTKVKDLKKFESQWKLQTRKMCSGICVHEYKEVECPSVPCGNENKSVFNINLLTGCISSVWDDVALACNQRPDEVTKVARVEAKQNEKSINLIGIWIPCQYVEKVSDTLKILSANFSSFPDLNFNRVANNNSGEREKNKDSSSDDTDDDNLELPNALLQMTSSDADSD